MATVTNIMIVPKTKVGYHYKYKPDYNWLTDCIHLYGTLIVCDFNGNL